MNRRQRRLLIVDIEAGDIGTDEQTTKKRRSRRRKKVEPVLLFVIFVSSWFVPTFFALI